MGTEMVVCPVCKGTKHSLYHSLSQCHCCKGEGSITKEREAILARIREDLIKRLRERFPDDPTFS